MANMLQRGTRSSLRPASLPPHVFTQDEIAGDRLSVEYDGSTLVITMKDVKPIPQQGKGPQLRFATINNRVTNRDGSVRGYFAAPLGLQVQTEYGIADLNLQLDLNAWCDLPDEDGDEA